MNSRIGMGLWSIGGRILSGTIRDPRGGTTPTTGFAFSLAGAGQVEPDAWARRKHASFVPRPSDHAAW